MERRNFFRLSALGLAGAISYKGLKAAELLGFTAEEASTDLVAVMGTDPVQLVQKALEEFGGIKQFVKPGAKVVIKPNIGWAKTPEMAANTNPTVVGELTRLCLEAGAKEVVAFDHTCHEWTSCYESSGIKKAVQEAGGKMQPGNSESYYKTVALPKGKVLQETKIHQAILDCDVWFNVPVLKNHSGAKMSVSMKNYMGIVWDRGTFHQKNLQQCIADVCTYSKKPALNIVDAYRTLTQNGPQSVSVEDSVQSNALFASRDIVAVDTAAVKFFAQMKEMDLATVSHIGKAEELGLGTTNLSSLEIKRIKL